MGDNEVRLQLECRIADCGDKLHLSLSDVDWLDTKEWSEFIENWYDLIDYYESGDDTVITAIALQQFADFTRILRKVLLSGELSPAQMERADEELITLEGIMDKITTEAIMNLRDQRPDLDI